MDDDDDNIIIETLIKLRILRPDLTRSRYDLSTFVGRYKHFFGICNPINLLKTSAQLDNAKDIVTRYNAGQDFPNLSNEELWRQQTIYLSAFHPITDDKMFWLGRMSAQSPMNALIVGAMLSFYKTRPQILFWQWINQSFNAIVNQVNASEPQKKTTAREALTSYVTPVGLALGASLLLNGIAEKMGPSLFKRLVPFGAVSVANAVNIPLCRLSELKEGIPLWFGENQVAKSRKMARKAISEVVISRICIAVPHMVLVPLVVSALDKRGFWRRNPRLAVPFQFSACGAILLFSTPLGCALFPQMTFVPVGRLEPEVQEELKRLPKPPKMVYYNKGL